MGMSTHAIGFKPPDEKWSKMRAVWDACRAAGLRPPREVGEFFNDDAPDPRGVEVPQRDLISCGAVNTYEDGGRSGYEIDVKKLPPDVTIVRVYNAW